MILLTIYLLLTFLSGAVSLYFLEGPYESVLHADEWGLMMALGISCGILPGAALIYAWVLYRRYR